MRPETLWLHLAITGMNRLSGHIDKIKTAGQLSIVTVRLTGHMHLSAIIIETPKTVNYLKEKNAVDVLFKETEVIVSVADETQTSVFNAVEAVISKIEEDVLLSRISLSTDAGMITAIIATEMIERLGLRVGKKAKALIKLNEIMLAEQ